MTQIIDGHMVKFYIVDMAIQLEVLCPYEGKKFDYTDSPVCRLQQEDGNPGLGPYQSDHCIVDERVRDLGGGIEAFMPLPGTQPNSRTEITAVPMAILYSWDEGDFYIAPVPPRDPAKMITGRAVPGAQQGTLINKGESNEYYLTICLECNGVLKRISTSNWWHRQNGGESCPTRPDGFEIQL